MTTRIAFTRPSAVRDASRILFTTTFLLRIATKDNDNPIVFDLSATTEVTYALAAEPEIADTDLEEFGRINVPFNAWGFWRELTQSSLARLGLPVFALPLFRIQDAASLMVDSH